MSKIGENHMFLVNKDHIFLTVFSFNLKTSLMKRLRHPNILLFMGTVASPQRICIVTEFLRRLVSNPPPQIHSIMCVCVYEKTLL